MHDMSARGTLPHMKLHYCFLSFLSFQQAHRDRTGEILDDTLIKYLRHVDRE